MDQTLTGAYLAMRRSILPCLCVHRVQLHAHRLFSDSVFGAVRGYWLFVEEISHTRSLVLDLFHRPLGCMAPNLRTLEVFVVREPPCQPEPEVSCDAVQPQQFSCKPDLLLPSPSRQSPFFLTLFTPYAVTPHILALGHMHCNFLEFFGFTFSVSPSSVYSTTLNPI